MFILGNYAHASLGSRFLYLFLWAIICVFDVYAKHSKRCHVEDGPPHGVHVCVYMYVQFQRRGTF